MNRSSSDALATPQRRHDIDWLRLMAVFLLFSYHTARIFDPHENFYIHSDPPSQWLYNIFIWAVGPWHMNLFFLLAGASTYYALRRRSGGQYVRERFKRLFIPFIFGVLVLIPPQSYLGLLNHSGSSKSFFEWFPEFFTLKADDIDGYFLGGHTWGHLWFILHLFVYSLLAVSLFLYLNGTSGRRLVGRLAEAFTRPVTLFLFPVPLIVANEFPEVAGGNPLFYIIMFIYGYILMSDPRFTETIDRRRTLSLIMGPLIFAVILVLVWAEVWPSDLPTWTDDLTDAYVESVVPWFVILALLGYGRRFLNFSNGFLRYFSAGAYALYILHQTIIVIIGYYVVQWDTGVLAKFALIVAGSFAAAVLVYDLVVKRTNVARFLFGMGPKKRPPAASAPRERTA